ncbi:hypothetical protein IVB69_06065 [Flavobacterium sp. J49]|uniref:hypothetical protein n=1 Tax=Flavobacterium sp. J49 TaxID=2718534 RepID=UPI001593DBC2|nr:hypothetical protein [Flavobacterium sp. J49]MBF6641039.1 hypothetical protein [Flavobacterium sp. J49]NIC02286.1 hypothetical protein [Flavobacterium sp. J49]
MKKLFLLLVTFSLYSQKKIYSCDDIKEIIDYKIYDTLSNGKLIARFDKVLNQKIYKVKFENNQYKYVTKSLMKNIKKSIKENNCDDFIIEKVDKNKDPNINLTR